MLKRFAFPIFYLSMIFFALLARQPGDEMLVTLRLINDAGGKVQYFLPQRLELRSMPQETNLRLPAFLGTPRFGALPIRVGGDSLVSIAIDETAAGVRRIFIDRNNDENLTNDGPGEWSERRENYLSLSAPLNMRFSPDDHVQLTFQFYRFDRQSSNALFYYRDYFAEGTLHTGEQSYKIALLDDNADGRLGDLSHTALLVDTNQDGKLEAAAGSAELFAAREPFHLHGETYVLREVVDARRLAKFAVSSFKVDPKTRLEVGAPAPEFSTTDLSGVPMRLADYRGRVVLLHFWATWCKPCLADLPLLAATYRQFREAPNHSGAPGNFDIIGVSLDEDRDALAHFLENRPIPWRVVCDGNGWQTETARRYRVSSLPQSFLIDESGVIRFVDLRGEALPEAITQLMEKQIANSASSH